MAFVLESGAGLANSNSFASVAEGDAFSAQRLYSTAWTGATNGNKEAALQQASRIIDSAIQWNGSRMTETQAMGWPRQYAAASISYATAPPTYTYYEDDIVPKGVKDATCELAIELLKADRTADAASKGIKSIGLGQGALDIEFDAEDALAMIPVMVSLLLRPFGMLLTGKSSARYVTMLRV